MKKKIRNILIIFSIFLLIILLLFYLVFHLSLKRIENTLTDMASSQLLYARNQLMEKQKAVESQAAYMTGIEDVRLFESRITYAQNTYDSVTEIREIKEVINSSMNSVSDMESVIIYWNNLDVIYSNKTQEYNRARIEMIKEVKTTHWEMTENGLVYYLCYPYNTEDGSQSYTIALEVKNSYLETIRASMGSIEDSHSFLKASSEIIANENDSLNQEILQRLTDQPLNENVFAKKMTINQQSYLVLATKLEKSDLDLVSYIKLSNFMASTNQLSRITLLAVIGILTTGLIIMYLFYKNILKQLSVLTESFKKVENGDFSARITYFPENEFSYVFTQFNQMVGGAEHLLISLSKEMKMREIAEARHYQAQINPHFLYNSLFYIIAMSQHAEAVTQMATHLAEYYKYRTKKVNQVTIADEVEFARHYLSVISLRKKVDFSIEISEEIKHAPILPLLLQPLIENAIEHGIEEKKDAGLITITGYGTRQQYTIGISDDGIGLSPIDIEALVKRINRSEVDNDESIGLWNVNQRLINRYGRQSALKIGTNSWGGLTVSFTVHEGDEANEALDR